MRSTTSVCSGLRALPFLLAAALVACGTGDETHPVGSGSYALQGAKVDPDVHHDVSPRLDKMAPAERRKEHRLIPVRRPHGPSAAQGDAVVQSSAPGLAIPSTATNFDGVGNGFSGPQGTFTVNSAPPDTNGDVGPNHYVQVVNTDFAVFNKSGNVIYGPVPLNTLWSGFGGGCQTNNDGDPVVQYDQIADRWIITQFSVSTTPYLQCVAVSVTGDPTGAYNRYAFQPPGGNFPDYPKLAVWPDAYYISFNMFSGNTFMGPTVCAYNRSAMLAGAAASQECFALGTAYASLLPADLDGSTLPPTGSPNYYLGLDSSGTALDLFKFHVDWTTPSAASLSAATLVAVAGFTEACNGGTCIPQTGTRTQLDSLADRLMYRNAYRNFGDHEALVVNHSVAAGSSTGVRWYEVRSPGGAAAVYQQGTFAPDSNHRWMGSAAMDHGGDIAIGYSVSGSSIHPQIRYAGRLAGDPLGQLSQGEGTIINGAGSQSGNLSRWGDYSGMAIDPADDCTFWYTNEYIPANGSFNWKTRIASFKLPGCNAVPSDFSVSVTPASSSAPQGGSTTYSVSAAVTSGSSETVTLSVSGLPNGVTGTFSPPTVTSGGAPSTLTLSVAANAPTSGPTSFTVTGTSGATSHNASPAPTIAVTASDFSITVSPPSQSAPQGGSTTYTVSTAVTQGVAQTVSLSISGLPAGATASFNPASVTAGGSATLTVSPAFSTPAGTSSFTVTGTGSSATHAAAASLTVTASDFSIAATPASQTVAQGGSTTYTVSTAVSAGAAESVSLSVSSGLPAGATASFNPATVTAGGSSTLTVTTASTTPVGTYSLTITGNGQTATHGTTVSLTVTTPPPSDFSLAITPTSASAAQGGSASYSISAAIVSGGAETVSLSVSGLPAGVTGAPNPSSITSGGAASALALSVGFGAAPGSTVFTVTGTDPNNGVSHSVTATITVTASDFSVTATPASQTIALGGSGSYSVATAVTSGVAQQVTLTVTGAPAGVNASLSPTSVAAGSGSTLSVSVTTGAAPGTYSLTVTGTGQTGSSHSSSVTLVVSSNPIVNGGFETGNFSGWTASGAATAVIAAAAHSGSYGARLGATTPTSGDSTTVQTFTVPSSGGNLSFYYRITCPDTVTYDWATASLKDNVTGVTTTLLAKTCTNTGAWSQLSYNLSASAGHGVTLTLTSHDDNYASDPTYTDWDDVSVAPPPPNPVVNPGFESGNFSGWTASGAPSSVVAAAAHSGSFGAQLGATTPTSGDSSISQTFTVPSGARTLSFWYQVHCPDTVTYDWATATLKDNTTNTTSTILAKTCTNTGAWVNLSAPVTAGHSVTLTLTSHDDNYATDPTYTWYDDVSVF